MLTPLLPLCVAESQPTTSDETVVAGGTVMLKCLVEDPDDSSLQWSNPAQQTLYFGEKRGTSSRAPAAIPLGEGLGGGVGGAEGASSRVWGRGMAHRERAQMRGREQAEGAGLVPQ